MVSSQYLDVMGVPVHVLEGGSGEPLVLLHGIGASAGDFAANLDYLSQHFHVYAPDIPGFGQTPPPADYYPTSIDKLEAFLFAFLDRLGLQKVKLIGWSLGGAIALAALLRAPDRFSRVMVVGSAGLGAEVHFIFRLLYLWPFGELLTLPNRLTMWVNYKFLYTHNHAAVSPEFLERARQAAQRPWHKKTTLSIVRRHHALTRGQKEIDVHARLAEVKVPLHLVWGAEDRIIPAWHGERAKKLAGNAEYTVFENCGHMPFLEEKERFHALALKFFQG